MLDINLTRAALLVADRYGVYVPQRFVEAYDPAEWGVSEADAAVLRAGPEHEHYWETWDDVLSKAQCVHKTDGLTDGLTYALHQDGDLWAVPIDDLYEDTEVAAQDVADTESEES